MTTPRPPLKVAVTSIDVVNHYRLPNHTIDLNGRRHLVLTGPNGSGKTSLVAELAIALVDSIPGDAGARHDLSGTGVRRSERGAFRCAVEFTRPPDFVVYLPANRWMEFVLPPGPSSLVLRQNGPNKQMFLQTLVNLFTTMHLRQAEEPRRAAAIRTELDILQDGLRELFVQSDLMLRFDKETFSLDLVLDGRGIRWDKLPAGYRAVLEVVADLFMRTRQTENGGLAGVVLIDEPELHLHPEMQERILPALTGLFPNLQFIVATHAPPVISSLDDAWVHDLRHLEGISSSELQGRPYGAIMKSHFGVPTDYDRATTKRVEAALEMARSAATPAEKSAARDALQGLLETDDARVLDAWNDLSLELAGK